MAPPATRSAGQPSSSMRPKPARKAPNKIRQVMLSEERRSESVAAAAAAVAAAVSNATATGTPVPTIPAPSTTSRGGQCPNKNCKNPNVVDGTCQSCGRVADDSNIVSDIQFGETSSGAAVVQGTFLAADQGTFRSVPGQQFRRVAGGGASETRERNLRQAKQMLRSYAQQLGGVPQLVVDQGELFYRLCAGSNFVQGRTTRDVVAACLYSACRANPNNDVQLIDIADLLRVNVFSLGRTYTAIQRNFPTAHSNKGPILLENIVWKFTAKLGFDRKTNEVATTAVRIINRMQRDWMTPGRKPGGLVAAALLIAARLHNFRRTEEEVIYVAKVTEHTIHERMKEFAYLPTSQFTIEEFLNQDPLQTEFDPPVFYKQTEEWKEKYGPRKYKTRRRMDGDNGDEEPGDEEERATPAPSIAGRETPNERDASPSANLDPELATPTATATPAGSSRTLRPRQDADGFAIPPVPTRSGANPVAPEVALAGADDNVEGEDHLAALAAAFGDRAVAQSSQDAFAAQQGIQPVASTSRGRKRRAEETAAADDPPARHLRKGKGKAKSNAPPIPLDDQWKADEQRMIDQVGELLHDPLLLRSARAVVEQEDPMGPEMARLRQIEQEEEALEHASIDAGPSQSTPAAGPSNDKPGDPSSQPVSVAPTDVPIDPRITPASTVSMQVTVEEDEFADDPEVQNCMLQPAEIAIKERIWVNANKDWLRAQQAKIWKQKMEAKNPPKPKRPRKKKPRIGEAQTSPASTPGEAAVEVLKMRAVSKRINYDKIGMIFDKIGPREQGAFDEQSLISARSTRRSRSSRAGSTAGDGATGSVGSGRSLSASPAPAPTSASTTQTPPTDSPASQRNRAAKPGLLGMAPDNPVEVAEDEVSDPDDYVDNDDEDADDGEQGDAGPDPFESGDEDYGGADQVYNEDEDA